MPGAGQVGGAARDAIPQIPAAQDAISRYEMPGAGQVGGAARDAIPQIPAAQDAISRYEMPGAGQVGGAARDAIPQIPAAQDVISRYEMPGAGHVRAGAERWDSIPLFGQAENLSYTELEKLALDVMGNAQKSLPQLETSARPELWKMLQFLSSPRLVGNLPVAAAENTPAANLPFETARQAAGREILSGEMPGVVQRLVKTEPVVGQSTPNFSEMDVQDLLDALKREAWREYERFYGPVR